MDYVDHRDWAVSNKGSVEEIAGASNDPFLVQLGVLYSVSDVHQGRMILNTFDEKFRELYKMFQATQTPPPEPEKAEDLGADVGDDVNAQDTGETQETINSQEEEDEARDRGINESNESNEEEKVEQ